MPTPDEIRTLKTQIAPAAVAASRLTGIPAELLCAQCILESGWLKHAPGKNCFGIKSYPGAYGRQLLATFEWFTPAQLAQFRAWGDGRTAIATEPARIRAGKQLYQVQDWFATFAALSDCFTRRASMFTEGRYLPYARAYRETANLEAFVRGIGPIYATDPAYADRVLVFAQSPEVTNIVDQLHIALTGYEEVNQRNTRS